MSRDPHPALPRPPWWRSPRQLALLGVVTATFALVVLWTPWQRVSADGSRSTFAGHAPLFRPPSVPLREKERQGYSVVRPLDNHRVDRGRLAVQLAVCGLAAAGVGVLLRE